MTPIIAEYLWIDGSVPTQKLRSKTKIIYGIEAEREIVLGDFPGWTFDGSSTNQAEGDASDCLLEPVRFVPDPIRGDGAFLVLYEVNGADGSLTQTNELVCEVFLPRGQMGLKPGLDMSKSTPSTRRSTAWLSI